MIHHNLLTTVMLLTCLQWFVCIIIIYSNCTEPFPLPSVRNILKDMFPLVTPRKSRFNLGLFWIYSSILFQRIIALLDLLLNALSPYQFVFQVLAILMLSDYVSGCKSSALEEAFNRNLLASFLLVRESPLVCYYFLVRSRDLLHVVFHYTCRPTSLQDWWTCLSTLSLYPQSRH